MVNFFSYFLIYIFLLTHLNSKSLNSFVLSENNLLNIKTITKIIEIGNEIKNKTSINIYINVKYRYKNIEIKNMKDKILFFNKYENNITKNLEEPYILITTSIIDKHINIIFSNKDLDKIIDKKNILNDYILPLFTSYDKNSQSSKISAGLLNGYGEIADNIANHKNIELKSTIRSEVEIFAYLWKYFVYGLVLLGIFAYIFAMIKNRKVKL